MALRSGTVPCDAASTRVPHKTVPPSSTRKTEAALRLRYIYRRASGAVGGHVQGSRALLATFHGGAECSGGRLRMGDFLLLDARLMRAQEMCVRPGPAR